LTTTDLELEFKVPAHLYVPSPPLWIEATSFRGPLDLLLYLIRQQNFDVLDIPMAVIAQQYLEYLHLMQDLRFELAPDYLLMAVRLLEIKSQCLLPRMQAVESPEDDPRALLVQQLCEYEKYQQLGSYLDSLPRWERDLWPIQVQAQLCEQALPPIEVKLEALIKAYQGMKQTQALKTAYQVETSEIQLSEVMQHILAKLNRIPNQDFYQILPNTATTLEIIVNFQAVLELCKNDDIVLAQDAWQDLLMITLKQG